MRNICYRPLYPPTFTILMVVRPRIFWDFLSNFFCDDNSGNDVCVCSYVAKIALAFGAWTFVSSVKYFLSKYKNLVGNVMKVGGSNKLTNETILNKTRTPAHLCKVSKILKVFCKLI